MLWKQNNQQDHSISQLCMPEKIYKEDTNSVCFIIYSTYNNIIQLQKKNSVYSIELLNEKLLKIFSLIFSITKTKSLTWLYETQTNNLFTCC